MNDLVDRQWRSRAPMILTTFAELWKLSSGHGGDRKHALNLMGLTTLAHFFMPEI
jgi:hypothetical protein